MLATLTKYAAATLFLGCIAAFIIVL